MSVHTQDKCEEQLACAFSCGQSSCNCCTASDDTCHRYVGCCCSAMSVPSGLESDFQVLLLFQRKSCTLCKPLKIYNGSIKSVSDGKIILDLKFIAFWVYNINMAT